MDYEVYLNFCVCVCVHVIVSVPKLNQPETMTVTMFGDQIGGCGEPQNARAGIWISGKLRLRVFHGRGGGGLVDTPQCSAVTRAEQGPKACLNLPKPEVTWRKRRVTEMKEAEADRNERYLRIEFVSDLQFIHFSLLICNL